MIELVFGSADLLQVRFAISPAEEVLGAVRTVAQPTRHAYHLPWLRRLHDTDLNELAELAALVTAPDYTPDFLSPPRFWHGFRDGPRASIWPPDGRS